MLRGSSSVATRSCWSPRSRVAQTAHPGDAPLWRRSVGAWTSSPAPGLVHHSDQGTQYASNKYVDTLRENDVKISMSRQGTPGDNAFAESFMKTLKTEEVDCNEYATLAEAQSEIGGLAPPEFSRHGQIYRSDGRVRSGIGTAPDAHRFDESAARVFLGGLLSSRARFRFPG